MNRRSDCRGSRVDVKLYVGREYEITPSLVQEMCGEEDRSGAVERHTQIVQLIDKKNDGSTLFVDIFQTIQQVGFFAAKQVVSVYGGVSFHELVRDDSHEGLKPRLVVASCKTPVQSDRDDVVISESNGRTVGKAFASI